MDTNVNLEEVVNRYIDIIEEFYQRFPKILDKDEDCTAYTKLNDEEKKIILWDIPCTINWNSSKEKLYLVAQYTPIDWEGNPPQRNIIYRYDTFKVVDPCDGDTETIYRQQEFICDMSTDLDDEHSPTLRDRITHFFQRFHSINEKNNYKSHILKPLKVEDK